MTSKIQDYKESKEYKEWKKRVDSFQKYTWEELAVFRRDGVEGEVCICDVIIANTMTIECVNCGKVSREYAKKYAERNK